MYYVIWEQFKHNIQCTRGENNMTVSKEELITKIEEARQRLNNSIDSKKEYEIIYKNSVELDLLIEQYMVAGY